MSRMSVPPGADGLQELDLDVTLYSPQLPRSPGCTVHLYMVYSQVPRSLTHSALLRKMQILVNPVFIHLLLRVRLIFTALL